MAASGGEIALPKRLEETRTVFPQFESWSLDGGKGRARWEQQLKAIRDFEDGAEPAAMALDLLKCIGGWLEGDSSLGIGYFRWEDIRELNKQTDWVRYYAVQTKNRDLEREATVVRCKLMIRLGELIRGMKKEGILTEHGGDRRSKCDGATLKTLGIDKHLAADCQTLAKSLKEERAKIFDDIGAGRKTISTAVKGLALAKSRGQRTARIDRQTKKDSSYSVIYADPPWKYSGDPFPNQPHVSPQNQYDVMDEKDIATYLTTEKVKIASDAVLFMWATVPLTEQGFRIVAAWGFKYKTMIIWDKKAPLAMGSWLPIQTELLLVGTKGKMPPPGQNKKGTTNLISIRKTRHSAKPDQFYDLIERLYPKLTTRLELFARKPRPGWDHLGNDPALDLAG